MENEVRRLHTNLWTAWNKGDADAFSAQFVSDGICIGFDGSEYTSTLEVKSQLGKIFKDHQVASYVGEVHEVRFLSNDIALSRAVVGMMPPDSAKVVPERNALQIMVAARTNDDWRVISYQNTPAKLDGHPEAVKEMTSELQTIADQLLK